MGRTRWGAAPGPVGGRGDGEWGARNHPLDGLPRLPSAEVPDAIQAGEQLEAAGLAAMLSAAGDVELAWQQVADLLTVPELLGVLASQLGGAALKGAVPQAVASGRQQLLETLERQAQLSLAARQHLESALLAATGVLLRLGTAAVCTMQRVLRLFFLNESHTLSQVVWRRGVAVCTRRLYARHGTQTVCAHGLPPPPPPAFCHQFLAADLGAVRYPDFRVHRTCSAFRWVGARVAGGISTRACGACNQLHPPRSLPRCRARQQLLDYEQALAHAARLADALEACALREALAWHPTLALTAALTAACLQINDTAAAEEVLKHAWAALDAGTHKLAGGSDWQDGPLFLRRFHAGEARSTGRVTPQPSAWRHAHRPAMCTHGAQGGCSA